MAGSVCRKLLLGVIDTPACRRRLAVRALGLAVDFLLFALDLGQLGRRAAELLGHGGQAVFQQLGLLLLLGQQGFLVLVVVIQRVNARLIQFVLLLQGGLLLLVLGHAALKHHRIVGTAGQSDQPQGHRSRRPRRAWHGRRPPSNPPRKDPGDILFACIDLLKRGPPVTLPRWVGRMLASR